MNIFHLSLVGLLCLGIVCGDKDFKPPKPAGNESKHIKTAAKFGDSGAKMEICPSGDCDKGQMITLSMSRLEEVDAGGKNAANKAENFNKLNVTWTSFTNVTIGNLTAMSSSYNSKVEVGKSKTKVDFNITATIFPQNGTVMNGNQMINVPAGALKFTISMGKWPFINSANYIHFGITLSAKGKDGKEKTKPTKGKRNDTKTEKIDRLDMGEGMYMDSPDAAMLDGAMKPINSTVETSNNQVEYIWAFPSYTNSLFYDPIVGSTDPSAQVSGNDTDASTNGTSPTPTTSNSANVPGSVCVPILAIVALSLCNIG